MNKDKKELKPDPYADWEIAYSEDVHRADVWLNMSVRPEDRVIGEGGVNWLRLTKDRSAEEEE